ncbi:endoglucanase 9, partial [Phtheirospermum japonicum]
ERDPPVCFEQLVPSPRLSLRQFLLACCDFASTWGSFQNLIQQSHASLDIHVGGLMCKTDGSNLQYVTAITFLLTTYVKYLANGNSTKHSFKCGGQIYTASYLRVIVKSQSKIIPRIACGEGFSYLQTSEPNPNNLTGAIVGGPNRNDGYADDRNNF